MSKMVSKLLISSSILGLIISGCATSQTATEPSKKVEQKTEKKASTKEDKTTGNNSPHSYRDMEVDSDHDGIIDAKDRCRYSQEGVKVNEYGCMYDNDRDGVADENDHCANSLREFPVDKKGCTVRLRH